MIEIKATHRAPIKLGHTGENEAVRVAFSLLPFKETFPDGVPALLARRKGDATAYPVPLAVEEYTAYWTVTRADTEKAGFGQCELQWIVGNTLAKSDKFDFFVVKALEAGAEAPDAPSKAWFEAIQGQIGDLSKLTTEAKENLVAAINEAARTGGGSGGGTIEMRVSDGYIQYSNDGVTWENLIAVSELKGETGPQGFKGDTGPQGPQGISGERGADGAAGKDGSDGYSPEATVTPINGGVEIIIKDRNGTTSANVMNGARGPKGDKGEPGAAGPQGPKGDPGATDFSLGITGARVGQIAKITAVDETGKPTAWEPVDKVGMSNDWVLLADITLAEDSAVIKIDKTSAGNSFSIRELAVFGGVKCDTVNKTLTLSVNGKIGYGNPQFGLGQVLNAAESDVEYIAAYVNALPECLFARVQHNQYQAQYMSFNAPSFSASSLRNETQIAAQLIGNPITVFALSPWESGKSGVFKAGTSLKFYGRE